jgi:hypothetical protein
VAFTSAGAQYLPMVLALVATRDETSASLPGRPPLARLDPLPPLPPWRLSVYVGLSAAFFTVRSPFRHTSVTAWMLKG